VIGIFFGIRLMEKTPLEASGFITDSELRRRVLPDLATGNTPRIIQRTV